MLVRKNAYRHNLAVILKMTGCVSKPIVPIYLPCKHLLSDEISPTDRRWLRPRCDACPYSSKNKLHLVTHIQLTHTPVTYCSMFLLFDEVAEGLRICRKADKMFDQDIYHIDGDTRFRGTFLAKTKWNQAIEGLALPYLLKVASAPGEHEPHLQALHKAIRTWLDSLAAILPNLDLTFLRWINTANV